MKKKYLTLFILGMTSMTFAQFHTLNLPSLSPKVTESQKLGVTSITIDYSSPALRGRDVWNDPNIVPQKGVPIAWRAGANMATTITFSTDVIIEGKPLKAGKYGFHIIPNNDQYTLLFAHNYNQWGSYYLDRKKDISLEVVVKPETCSNSEQLDFEFLNRSESMLVIALEWGKKRIPFKVGIDLNKTVIESFRNELRGINTYHWQAWNDAASWCLNHNTNLEEAYQWVNRSINGGYGGFAAHKDVRNLATKIRLISKLGKIEDLDATIEEASQLIQFPWQANYIGQILNRGKFYARASKFTKDQLNKYPKAWGLLLTHGVSEYFIGNKKQAIKMAKESLRFAPKNRKGRIKKIMEEFIQESYKQDFR